MISWDERYGEAGYAYGTEPNSFLAEHARLIPSGGAVLCLAEGEGRNAVWLGEQGYKVTGVDSSSVGLNKAKALAAERGVSIDTVCADLAGYSVEPTSWDGVVSIFCHVTPPIRQRLHAEVVAGLKPGGVLILEAYRPKQLEYGTGGPPVAELMMQLDVARAELDGLEWVHAVELDRPVVEGKYHTGMGAVVQLIGRKL
ncbi:MAG: class I SAM-dependent methyltransferase [Gammaproteobacteria bacterium]|nr:class I SAM-dependent methyltransferase [Gammaproteobacteria bacterium]